ncbi:MAG: FAD-dependent oxidoreductase [Akkermansiaceae bacterium]|nr:FAD-dependent oxidoreductase [Akkermansiaceae bacterium]
MTQKPSPSPPASPPPKRNSSANSPPTLQKNSPYPEAPSPTTSASATTAATAVSWSCPASEKDAPKDNSHLIHSTDGKTALWAGVVDERPHGGTCALRGCQPEKYLVCNAETVAMASHLGGRGIKSAPETDWPALQKLKNEFLEGHSDGEVKDWQKAGVTTSHERAVMSGEDELTIGDQRIKAKHIVLATGTSPRRTEISGMEHIKVSDDFLDLPELPKRITFIGGGYISFEFAHVAIRAGAEEVTIIHRSDQPLKAFDSDIVKVILEASAHAGIKVVLNESPASVQKTDEDYCLTGSSGTKYNTDLIIEATGRVPYLSVLEGNAGNVTHTSTPSATALPLPSCSPPSLMKKQKSSPKHPRR